nr:hypothetical protein [uncultured bacterium]
MTSRKEAKTNNYLSLGISFLALIISGITLYYSILRQGHLEVKFPARIGWVTLGTNEQIHGKDSDVIILSFVVHNNGNSFRSISSMELSLQEEGNPSSSYTFRAHGQFSTLRDITYFTEKSLEGRVSQDESGNTVPDYNYSLITGIPLDKNEYKNLSLLFLNEENSFEMKPSTEYQAKLVVYPFDERRQDKTEVCFTFSSTVLIPRTLVASSYLVSAEVF